MKVNEPELARAVVDVVRRRGRRRSGLSWIFRSARAARGAAARTGDGDQRRARGSPLGALSIVVPLAGRARRVTPAIRCRSGRAARASCRAGSSPTRTPAGLGVQVWTVDAEADAGRLLDWGVDALITDRPDIMVPFARGRATAPGVRELSMAEEVAVVTGAGSESAEPWPSRSLKEGYAVVLAGRRTDRLEQTAAEAGDASRSAPDRRDRRRRSRQRSTRCSRGPRRNSAASTSCSTTPGGSRRRVPLEDLTVDQWKAVVNVNLTGAFLCTQHAFRLMKDQQPRGGRIINNGSISAHVPRPNSAPYTATKHAITGLDAFDVARRPEVRHRVRPD